MPGKPYTPPTRCHVSDSNRRIIQNAGPSKRVYQVWKGSNRFFLGGRLIFGPDARSMVLTVFLIAAPLLLFAVFVSPNLTDELLYPHGNVILTIAIVLGAYDIIILFLTSGRDPGIIPRNAHPPEPEDGGASPNVSIEWPGSQFGVNTLPPTKDIFVNGMVVKVKYCHTCMLYRPPRCSHCSICNNCVENFDHHCPWVGQCVGKRNYRFFFMFVSSTTLLCLYVFAFCWVNLVRIMDDYECKLWEAILRSPVSGILILYTFIAAWFVGGLTTFHLYLICTNQTTYENFRYRYDGKKQNPYNRGWAQNVKEILFSKTPKSKINFRAKVKEDPTIFTSSQFLGGMMSPDIAKRSFDLDIAKRSFDLEMVGKRHGVASEEFEDIHSHIESFRVLERCGTQPSRSSWGTHKSTWEMKDDIEALAAEFGMEYGFADKLRKELGHSPRNVAKF